MTPASPQSPGCSQLPQAWVTLLHPCAGAQAEGSRHCTQVPLGGSQIGAVPGQSAALRQATQRPPASVAHQGVPPSPQSASASQAAHRPVARSHTGVPSEQPASTHEAAQLPASHWHWWLARSQLGSCLGQSLATRHSTQLPLSGSQAGVPAPQSALARQLATQLPVAGSQR